MINKQKNKFKQIIKLLRKLDKEVFFLHPIFLVFAIFCCIFWNTFYFLSFLLAILMHEYAHFWVAKSKGVVLNNFKLMPYGAQLSLRDCVINFKDDIMIAIAGPLINVLFCVLGVCFWWIFPETYVYTEFFVYSNFSLAFFNLLPLLPLDGSRIVLALATKYSKRFKVFKVLKCLNIIVSIFLFACFIISLFVCPNFLLGISSFFILFTAFEDEDKYFYESLIATTNSTVQKNKPLQLKLYCLDSESDVSCLFKLLNPNHYVGVVIMKDNKIKKVVMQKDFQQFINRGMGEINE